MTQTVSKATPSASVDPVNITYGTALSDSQLSGTATWTINGAPVNVLGTFTFTSAGGSILYAGNGQSENVTFAPTESTNYNNATPTATINVAKASLTISAVANTKTYDGTTDAGATPTVSGLQGFDSVTGLSESYDTANVGTGKTLTVNSGYVVNDGNGGVKLHGFWARADAW